MRTSRRMLGTVAIAAALGMGIGSTAMAASAADPAADARVRRCTPGYRPCIPNRASDVDCHGGSGNGPRYTRPGIVYDVSGTDRYYLDADNDGRGCE